MYETSNCYEMRFRSARTSSGSSMLPGISGISRPTYQLQYYGAVILIAKNCRAPDRHQFAAQERISPSNSCLRKFPNPCCCEGRAWRAAHSPSKDGRSSERPIGSRLKCDPLRPRGFGKLDHPRSRRRNPFPLARESPRSQGVKAKNKF